MLSFHARRFVGLCLSLLILTTVAGCMTGNSVPNLYDVKQRIIHYHNSGAYQNEVEDVVGRAIKHLHTYRQKDGNFAVVLDVDETSLSNWPQLVDSNFCYTQAGWNAWVKEADAPAIKPTLRLFNRSKEQGEAVFFVTGRDENQRGPTEANLEEAGYSGWEALIMEETGKSYDSAADFKIRVRQRLSAQGYHIILNMGDQASDLFGGYADKTFQLPNPFYRVP